VTEPTTENNMVEQEAKCQLKQRGKGKTFLIVPKSSIAGLPKLENCEEDKPPV
jgi:hypothetical protein